MKKLACLLSVLVLIGTFNANALECHSKEKIGGQPVVSVKIKVRGTNSRNFASAVAVDLRNEDTQDPVMQYCTFQRENRFTIVYRCKSQDGKRAFNLHQYINSNEASYDDPTGPRNIIGMFCN